MPSTIGALRKHVGRFRKNVGVFPKNVGDFLKNVGVFFQTSEFFCCPSWRGISMLLCGALNAWEVMPRNRRKSNKHRASALLLSSTVRQCFRHSSIHFHSKNTIFWRSRQISPIISRFGGEKRIEIEAKSFPIGHQTVNDRLGGNNSRRHTCTI